MGKGGWLVHCYQAWLRLVRAGMQGAAVAIQAAVEAKAGRGLVRDGFEIDQPKYGRTLAYVEAIPRAVAAIPGLRAVWPADDTMEVLLKEGLAQPRYDHLADQHSRYRAHHDAALAAIQEGRGVAGLGGRAALEHAGLYVWSRRSPTSRRTPSTALPTPPASVSWSQAAAARSARWAPPAPPSPPPGTPSWPASAPPKPPAKARRTPRRRGRTRPNRNGGFGSCTTDS